MDDWCSVYLLGPPENKIKFAQVMRKFDNTLSLKQAIELANCEMPCELLSTYISRGEQLHSAMISIGCTTRIDYPEWMTSGQPFA